MLEVFRNWLNRYLSDPQLVILAFLLVVGFLLIYTLGEMLAPVIASIIIAYLLEGMVERLEKFKIPRRLAVVIVFVLFITGIIIMLIILMPMVWRQVSQLLQELPNMLSNTQKLLMRLPEKYPEIVTEPQIKEVLGFLNTQLTNLGQYMLSLSLASVKGLMTIVVYFILVPLMIFFFLKDKSLILLWIKNLLPDNRGLANEVWHEVNIQIANYVRGKVWEILIVWSVSFIVFEWLDLSFSMLISLFVGLSVLIPYIGATIMTFPVALIAFLQWGIDSQTVYVLIAYGILQALDGNLLAPLLLSEVVDLHPVAIIVALLVFGGLWGIWGLFFAIPLATLFHAVLKAGLNKQVRDKRRKDAFASSVNW